jgi:high-affinity Fe2+/Pb2+ permease
MANDQRPPAGPGCLGSILGVVVLAGVVALVFLVGFVVLAVVAGLVVVGLLVWAVDRVLLALSPKRRERRAAQERAFQWQFGLGQRPQVIDTTAVDTTAVVEEPGPGPDTRPPPGPGAG